MIKMDKRKKQILEYIWYVRDKKKMEGVKVVTRSEGSPFHTRKCFMSLHDDAPRTMPPLLRGVDLEFPDDTSDEVAPSKEGSSCDTESSSMSQDSNERGNLEDQIVNLKDLTGCP